MTKIEKEVIKKLLEGEHPLLINFQRQYSESKVISRKMTGEGFYTYFDTSMSESVDDVNLLLDDVVADIEGLQNGAGFILFIEHGRIMMLEGYSFEEPWPTNVDNFSLKYLSGQERNKLELHKRFDSF